MLCIIKPGTRLGITFFSEYKCIMLQTFKACVLFSAAPSFFGSRCFAWFLWVWMLDNKCAEGEVCQCQGFS